MSTSGFNIRYTSVLSTLVLVCLLCLAAGVSALAEGAANGSVNLTGDALVLNETIQERAQDITLPAQEQAVATISPAMTAEPPLDPSVATVLNRFDPRMRERLNVSPDTLPFGLSNTTVSESMPESTAGNETYVFVTMWGSDKYATGISANTQYTLATKTVDTSEKKSATWVNQIARTDPISDTTLDPDALRLTQLLQIINNEGWNQTAVNSANDILSNKTHNSTYWQIFFTGFFYQHPFSNNLSVYLGYPAFYWFDDEVHRNLQSGLLEALKSNVIRITTDNQDFGLALKNDPILFQSFVNSNGFLDDICQKNIVNSSQKQVVFDFYKNYTLTYPQYYNSTVTINLTTNRFLSVARVQVYLSFKDSLPLTTVIKEEISRTLGLKGKYYDIFMNNSILVIDNNGLDNTQLNFIDRYSSDIPNVMYDLGSITCDDFLGNKWDDKHVWYVTKSSINIFSDKIGSYPENQFPEDISPAVH